ncbi:MAG: hypothetical protein ACYDCM_12655 [Candidatus Acidiferrales bacterium]
MRVDGVEVSWYSEKSQRLVRIANGEEVVLRHLTLASATNEQTLLFAAQKMVADGG